MCGFRLNPIPAEEHRKLSESTPPLNVEPEAIPLTRRKVKPRPRLEVVEDVPTPPDAAPPTTSDVHVGTERAGVPRRFPRFPLRVEVGYGSEHNFYRGFLENLSGGGLFVATHQPAQIGEFFEVTFTVPGLDRACTAVCRVRWLREYNPDSPDSVAGMGLQFSQLEPDARAAIELFIKHREPIFYDD
jgi:uncharacterized protein (TIGR02266 family)